VYICQSVYFSTVFNTLYQIPVTFRYANAVAYSYCDTEIQVCQFIQHPHNWRYSSASQHEVPVLLTNLIVYFQTFYTFISPSLHLQLFLLLYQKTNATKHIFAITPLMTVGAIKLHFW